MRILCATDLSGSSAGVVQIAATFSGLLGAELELFHARPLPMPYQDALADDRLLSDQLASAEAAITAQTATARARGAKATAHIEVGAPDAILDRARRTHPDLLVVGTHAREGFSRLVLGSVAERTIRTSPCPVLVVPSASTGSLGAENGHPRLKVVVGVDVSPASDAALAWLAALRSQIECDVRLVHLYVPAVEHERLGLPPPIPFEVNAEVVDVLARELRQHIEAATGTDFSLRIRPFWGGEDDPLAWEAETDDADLLVIGTSQARHSTALRTVRGAHLPVVCVPRGEVAPATKPLTPIKTVLLPTDFSPGSGAAVSEAYRLLSATGGDLVLAHVAQPDAIGLEPTRQEEIENCLLALVPEHIQAPHIRVRTLVVADLIPGEAIVKAIRRVGADLVVMAGRGAPGHRGGSGMATQHVVWNASQPVVVVPWPPPP